MSELKPSWSESRELGQEFARGMRGPMRWSLLASIAVILAIGAYFFIKAQGIAETRGELGSQSAASPSSPLPSDFADLCLLAQFMSIESLGQRVSALTDAAAKAGRAISWEQTKDGGILRVSWSDQLAKEDHEMGIELVRTPNAAALPDCSNAKEGAVATRINMDGEILSGLQVGVLLQQALPQKSTADAISSSKRSGNIEASQSAILSKDVQIKDPWDRIAIIHQWAEYDENCRGGSGDDPATQRACDAREAIGPQVNAAGYCLGTQDDPSEADMYWHRCNDRSLRFDGAAKRTEQPEQNVSGM